MEAEIVSEHATDADDRRIRFADLMATDHLAIDDDVFASLREHFSDPEIVELATDVALFVGLGRMGAALHVVDDLPERFRADGRVTPWGEGDVVRVPGCVATGSKWHDSGGLG